MIQVAEARPDPNYGLRNRRTLSALFALWVIMLSTVGCSDYKEKLEPQFLGMAKNVLDSKHRALINGTVGEGLDYNNLSERYKVEIQKEFAKELHLRTVLGERQAYNSFHSTITIQSINVSGNHARMKVYELLFLNFAMADKDPGMPKYTGSNDEHLFTFVVEGGRWKMDSDKLYGFMDHLQPHRLGDKPIPEYMRKHALHLNRSGVMVPVGR